MNQTIALAHFSNHCLLFQNSSHTAHNRRWNNQNTIWCLQNDTTFSKLITHPSKPNISIKTYNLCSIENVCFLIYLTMDNKTQTTAININLWNHHFNFCATPSQYWLFYHWQHITTLNPLASLSHGEVMIDYVINDCCPNFIRASYTNATSPDRGPSISTTASSSFWKVC